MQERIQCPVVNCPWTGTYTGLWRRRGHIWLQHTSTLEITNDEKLSQYLKCCQKILGRTCGQPRATTSDVKHCLKSLKLFLTQIQEKIDLFSEVKCLNSKCQEMKVILKTNKKSKEFICQNCLNKYLLSSQKIISAARIFPFIYAYSEKDSLLHIKKSANEVFYKLGWGHHESVYQEALKCELLMTKPNWSISTEIPITLYYKGHALGGGANSRLDLLVSCRKNNKISKILIELKAVSGSRETMDRARQQCKRYLSQINMGFGLKDVVAGVVINFPSARHRSPQCYLIV